MTPRLLLGASGVMIAAAVAAVVVSGADDKAGTEEAAYSGALIEVAADVKATSNTYAMSLDGGAKVAVQVATSGARTQRADFPCAWRARGTPAKSCGLALKDGGLLDVGEENTMRPGTWAGAGCLRKACVEYAGKGDGVP